MVLTDDLNVIAVSVDDDCITGGLGYVFRRSYA